MLGVVQIVVALIHLYGVEVNGVSKVNFEIEPRQEDARSHLVEKVYL